MSFDYEWHYAVAPDRDGVGIWRYARPGTRNYRYLWTSSLFSFTGMQMQQVARALLAWELTKSFSAVGAVSLSFGLPMLVFSLVGGSLADRFEKRNLSLVTQAATAAFALINALMVMTGSITINWLFVLGLGGGTAAALGMPARTPLMAEVVGRDRVMSAIAMSNAVMNGTRLFGPALASAISSASGTWSRSTSSRRSSTCSPASPSCGCRPA
jgi:MFS family permease